MRLFQMQPCRAFTMTSAAILGLFASVANAAVIHTNQTAFDNAVGAALLTENFDDDAGNGSPISIIGSDLSQISSDANQIFRVESFNGGEAVAVQGSASPVAWNTTFNFSSNVNAFGLLVHDLFEHGSETLSFETSTGESGTFLTAGLLADENDQYFGITNAVAFNSITLTLTGGSGDGALFDNVGYALESIPLPGTLALMASAGLAGWRRSR